jgi:N-acetylmuramoyl-L-alanine amidase
VGECVFSIAEASGLFWESIWQHPKNRELREKRGSPHVLLAGDKVFVPALERRQEERATTSRHRFRRKGIPLTLDLRLMDGSEPRAGVPYLAQIEGRTTAGTVPSDGVIRLAIQPSDRSGRLIVHPGPEQEEYPLALGYLDPVHSPSGVRARLKNLGLLGDDSSEAALARALTKFQNDRGLPTTGELDAATARELCEAHGS